ncbi:MAG: hypothetical protein ACRD1G_13065, partial [Acidimicrobiales bacterium]
MGGLIIRYALGATNARMAKFPPHSLLVSNVVTVATPHAGLTGYSYNVATTNGDPTEIEDMHPGSSTSTFMSTIS